MCQFLLIILGTGSGRSCVLTFSGNYEFSSSKPAMTTINVNRSLTIRSIINSFLKVIVLMHLFPTSGSFVGDPSGDNRGGCLLVTKKMHHFVVNNKTMAATATQVAYGSFKEVPAASLVLTLPTTTIQKKNIIDLSFVEEEEKEMVNNRRGEEEEEVYLIGDLMHYANYTAASHHVVTLEDTFVLARPFLPIYYNNMSMSGGRKIWFSSDNEEEEVYLSPLPYAEILDRIGLELFRALDRLVKWEDDYSVPLFQNIQVGCDYLNAVIF